MQKNDKGSTTLDYRLEFDTILFRSFANYVAALSCSFASRHIRVLTAHESEVCGSSTRGLTEQLPGFTQALVLALVSNRTAEFEKILIG